MRRLVFVLAFPAFAQSPPSTPTPVAMAVRMSQLMESTSVAVPDLVRASDPLRRQAENTIASIQSAPRNAAFRFRLINEVRAYLALSDAYIAPGTPVVAEQQLAELRDDLSRFQQRFETDLSSQADAAVAEAADPYDLHRYAEANTKLPPLGTLPRVVFLGDSITDGWRFNEYFSGRDFINRGINGQTTIQMLGRFLEDVAGLHPKAVVVLGGTNDIARGIAAQAVEDNLTMLGDLAKTHGVKPIFASLLPVSAEVNKVRPTPVIRQINQWLQDYCRREGFVYLDYFSALADANGQLPADLSDDGLHPNARGYRVMTPVALDAINHALEVNAASPAPAKKRLSLPVIK
jgi:lysophospholipase L1-like esterase